MTMSPLPTLESPQFQESGLCELPNAASMYEKILQAEARAVQDGANENVMLVRVVGHPLLELHAKRGIFGNRPCETIIDEVIPSSTGHGDGDNVVFEVGRRYRDHLICRFRTSTEPYRYPPPSSHPSRPSYDKTAKEKALARDDFQCMITGSFDETSVKHNAELQAREKDLGGRPTVVEACHILSESTTQGVGASEESSVVNKTHYAPGVLAILTQFGLERLAKALEAVNGVHEVWNLLSLEPHIHADFDSLKLWFESTDEPNRYEICFFNVTIGRYIRAISIRPETSGPNAKMVDNFSSDWEGAPPPDPKLLALHATCARVAHMSGAAEFLDDLERQAEETDVLAFDGSSAHLLSGLISPYAVIYGVA
ncbi:hypothetical protein BDM02DRAFT_3273075 [Thelephora ganbajun]|uniref:Uncharacterized protein n=1 Tax=Thelephora ganbajun TaxID=370292 RepID=A0ACB6Z138_THEGA|nr:hypothetical protein BDM02DRAFT_3273075 [Thelephora ganbajun]